MYLVNLLKKTHEVATLSRGYGRTTKGIRKVEVNSKAAEVGDEPLMFKKKFENAHVYVSENRCAGVETILHKHPSTSVILLDDAFQHMKIKAGLNILITRYSHPFWKDHMLPAGNLREPANGAARAQIVVVTGCPAEIPETEKTQIRQRISTYTNAAVFFATVKYTQPVAVNAAEWKGQYDSLLCVSGIANPQAFENQVKNYAGAVTSMAFGDHHTFTAADDAKIMEKFRSLPGEKAIITTQKDWVRLITAEPRLNMLNEAIPVFYQPIELSILDVPEKFDQLILQYAQTHS